MGGFYAPSDKRHRKFYNVKCDCGKEKKIMGSAMIEKHGPLGTAPAELVRLVLEQKDKEIRMLKAGMVEIERT